MKTVQDTFNSFKQGLSGVYDKPEIEALTMLVLNEITGSSKAKLKAFPELEITKEQSERLYLILNRLKTGEPVQYILGHAEFYGLKFEVNNSVLIPRPETEELVSWILESVATHDISILDIGTGSGCIAISLKNELKQAKVSAIDISAEALQTAQKNASLNHTLISFIKVDILTHQALKFDTKLDLIVSNPPYVTPEDKTQMHTNVTDFEPHTALFVPEDDPLVFYKAITRFAMENLSPKGLIFFEINEIYGEAIIKLLYDKSFINIELRKDMSGRDRMVKATWSPD